MLRMKRCACLSSWNVSVVVATAVLRVLPLVTSPQLATQHSTFLLCTLMVQWQYNTDSRVHLSRLIHDFSYVRLWQITTLRHTLKLFFSVLRLLHVPFFGWLYRPVSAVVDTNDLFRSCLGVSVYVNLFPLVILIFLKNNLCRDSSCKWLSPRVNRYLLFWFQTFLFCHIPVGSICSFHTPERFTGCTPLPLLIESGVRYPFLSLGLLGRRREDWSGGYCRVLSIPQDFEWEDKSLKTALLIFSPFLFLSMDHCVYR